MADRLLSNKERFRYFAAGQPNPEEWMSRFNGNPGELRDWLKTLPDGLGAYCLQAVEKVSKDYRMLCFSKSCDNILMWSHYGAGHQGMAIGCDSEGLKHALGANELTVECREDRVTFDAEQFLFPETSFARQLLTTKSPSWEYQEEVRFVVPHNGRSYLQCPPGLVRKILLGCKFPTNQIPCVKKLITRSGIQADLSRGEPDENLFKIKFRSV